MKKILYSIAFICALISAVLCFAACSGGQKYSVTCIEAENGRVTVADDTVEAGKKVILAAHPDAGYKLSAFILDGEELDGMSFVMPAKDVDVSARFEAITYSVTYVLDDATVAAGNPDSYTTETAGDLIEPEKDGYEICGWYRYIAETEYEQDIEEFRVKSLQGQVGNITLYARYYNPLHMISETESENGWYYVEGSGEARYGDTLNVVADPNTGYELDYVSVNGEAVDGTAFTMPMCDVEIAVKFKPVKYSLTYELDGGTNSPNNPSYYTIEDGEDGYISIEGALKEGYYFVGWYYIVDGYEQYLFNSSFYTYECKSVTLIAMFEPEFEEGE